MKKIVIFGLAILMAITLVISCDDTPATATHTVTFDAGEGIDITPIIVADGEKVTAPNPIKDGYEFIEWKLDGKTFDFNTAITKDITLTASWLKHINNLSEITGADFGYNNTFTGKADPIVIDSKATHYIVDEWQDLWYRGDVTIRNVEFAKGVSFYAQGDAKRKIIIEDCIIKWCDQKNDLLPKLDKNSNFRIDNSGNGLCLSFDGDKEGLVDVEVRNCTLIGDNNPEGERLDSYSTSKSYIDNKNNPSFKNFKGRGNGVGIGTASGGEKVKPFTRVLIDGCSFEGLRNAAVQLYPFNCPVTISNCDFKSWGINTYDIEHPYYTYAIRGNVNATSHANASLTIKNCTFDSTKSAYECKIDNLKPTIE